MLTLKAVPTYTYTCTACNDVIEKRQSFSDPPLTTCEQCGGSLRKVIHPVGIVFKGSGWYINDSRSSSSSANGPAPSTPSTTDTAKTTTDSTPKPSTSSSESSSSSSTSSTK
jgi:putative FmdB family regulatory protein